jgi:MoaA/NifB/PqqE/SkfB family radical SAM enzyme
MERVDVKTGFCCNNRCAFCVQGQKRKTYGNRSTEEVRDTLRQAREDSDSIVFTGGEVTIRKDFLDLVRYAHELGFRHIQIQTNGRMFAYRPFAEKTVAAGATEFSPAIHGPNAEIHDSLTRAEGSFRQTVEGIRNLKALRRRIIMNSVITEPNYRHLPATARLFLSLGVNQFQFAFVHALGTAGENFEWIVPRKSLVEPYVKEALTLARQAGVPAFTEAIPYCFMRGFEKHVAERIIPRTKIFDQLVVVDDYTDYRWTEGKVKGPPCENCAVRESCEGPWREYPEYYGWEEFKPRTEPLTAAIDPSSAVEKC